jgi:membrane-bound lytic murein transglycosylase D
LHGGNILAKWLGLILVFGISFPMWAKYLVDNPDHFISGKELVGEEDDVDAEDQMPEPTPELVKKADSSISHVPGDSPATAGPSPLAEPPKAIPNPSSLSGSTNEFLAVWRPPKYLDQDKALGHGVGAFAVPPGFEDRVQFWSDVYTKYNNDQGLLHDSKYIHLVYETVDLSDITANLFMTARQKDKAKEKRVKAAKAAVADRLKSLSSVKDPALLSGDDLRYWKLFEKIDDPNRFVDASRKGRLRFQAGQKDQFMRGITHSGRYLKQMEEVFREEGLPIELTRLPFVESSFNLNARSRVGASGLWQFMRSTGRSFLRINDACDERNDALKATRAAARKLKQDFEMLQSWPLTVTGWNHGTTGVRKLIERFHTREIVELTDVRRGRFKFASANFYASFLAALDVEKNADRYFGVLPVLAETKGEEIKLQKELPISQLVAWFGGDEVAAKLYNPHINAKTWNKGVHLHKKDFIRVPTELVAKVSAELGGSIGGAAQSEDR